MDERPPPVMFSTLLVTLALAGSGRGVVIDTKLELPNPSFLTSEGERITMDSSLSPKIIKAFYEVNFVPVSRPEYETNNIATVSHKRCPYSKDLCKYLYFVPSKISTVQKIEEMIEESEVPVVQGLVSKADEESVMRKVNETLHSQVNKVVNLSNVDRIDQNDTVPVYTGTIDTQQVLKKPEESYPQRPPSRPYYHYPPPTFPNHQWNSQPGTYNNPCLQGPCHWRTPFSSSISK